MLRVFVTFLVAIVVAQSQCESQPKTADPVPPKLPTLKLPYPTLPISHELPKLTQDSHILVVGGRGIAGAIARVFVSLGATVSVTTRNVHTYSRADNGLPEHVNVFNLEYGGHRDSGPRAFVEHYRARMLRNPDYIVDCGLTVYSGNSVDFDDDTMAKMTAIYQWGSVALESAFLKHNNPNQPVVHSTCLSVAGINAPPYFEEFYNNGKQFKFQHIFGSNAAQLYPNWRYVGVACSVTNTSFYINSINPSADAGDKAQVTFQEKLAIGALTSPNSADTVALAHAQAMLLPEVLDYETIFLSEPPSGTLLSELLFYSRTYLSGKAYTEAFKSIALNAFGVNITDH